MMKHDHTLTLYELSERTGIEARTLRSWVADGLLIAPDKSGRGATYPGINLDRALVVRALKGQKSMGDIRRMFLTASDDQIRDWAAGRLPEDREDRGSALDYLSGLQARSGAPTKTSLPPLSSEAPGREDSQGWAAEKQIRRSRPGFDRGPQFDQSFGDLAALERLVIQLDQLLNGAFLKRVRGETWTRLSVTRDLELSVRGNLEPDELAQFEHLAGQLRSILTGRIKHE